MRVKIHQYLKLLDKFKGLASVKLSDGRTCLLWWDLWENQVCAQVYPELFSFTKVKNVTIQKVLSPIPIDHLFHLSLSSEAYSQLLLLNEKLDSLQLTTSHDTWNYIWGSPLYSSSKAYKQLTGQASVPRLINGFGRIAVNTNTKSFFGYS